MQERLTNHAISDFFRSGRPQRAYKGEIVSGWENELAYVYFIEKGFIKAYSVSSEGGELIHLIYGPGEVFPLSWACTGIQREDYYQALSDSLLFKIPLWHFLKFSKSSIATSNALAELLAHQLNSLNDRLSNLEYKKPSQRLAYRLLFLASRFGYKQNDWIVIEGPFTHQLIANTINLARETVSREIASMEYDGILRQVNHGIIIKDLPELRTKLGKDTSLHGWGLD
jgi:CRP-like cAMP-binding protein